MFEILLNENSEADKREKVSDVSVMFASRGHSLHAARDKSFLAWEVRGRFP